MSIGFIGAGALAQALVTRMVAAEVGPIVISNRRGPSSLDELSRRFGPTVSAGTGKDAADQDLVVLSVPWSTVPAAVSQVRDWLGKTLIDTTNPLEAPTFRPADLRGRSSSEIVASLVIGAAVVKAFNLLSPTVLGSDPSTHGGRRAAFYAGDSERANRQVAKLMEAIGFVPIPVGTLAAGGALMRFPGGSLPARDLIQVS